MAGDWERFPRRTTGSSTSLVLGTTLLILRMYTSAGVGLAPLCAAVFPPAPVPLFILSSVSMVVARYALHVEVSASSSDPPSVKALVPPLPRPISSADGVPLFLQVLLTVTFLMSGKPSSVECWLCLGLLQLVTVAVLLLLLLSKPDSVSLKSAEVASSDWRLNLLRWQHRWLVVVSILEVLWCLDPGGQMSLPSPPQSWSWQDRKVISLLGMEIS